ncbi:MAG TPA: Uma2 family endonuclease [Thermoanaerobaculia bacterium]|nr:Uma2 family endonuclease [Thermoanaerobaculia bacterium]
MHAIPLREDETYYPDSDGEPVAESPVHLEEMVYVWEVLDERFEDDPNVFVGANMFLFYRKGDPRGVVAPDGFVVKGVPKLPGGVQRRKYMLWLEGGQVPCFVLETTSESTSERDKDKRRIYAQLGVAEYFQFDPFGEYLNPPLQGFRLVKGQYEPMRPNPGGSLLSHTLGVIFRADGNKLRLTDAATGVPLLRRKEIQKARRQAEEKAAAAEESAAAETVARRRAEEKAASETMARRQAEERSRALEEEIARLRAHSAEVEPASGL